MNHRKEDENKPPSYGYHFSLAKKSPMYTKMGMHPLDVGWFFMILPLMGTGIILKLIRIVRFGDIHSFSQLWEVFRLDFWIYVCILFLGWALTGLSRRPLSRFMVFLSMQAMAAMMILLEFIAHNYYIKTGSLMNFALLKHSIEHYAEIRKVAGSEANFMSLFSMVFASALAILLPWSGSIWLYLKRKQFFQTAVKEIPFAGRWLMLGLGIAVYAFVIRPGHSSEQAVFSRNFSYEVAWSLFNRGEEPYMESRVSAFEPPVDSYLARKRYTKRKNLVLIVLESTRADATSIYNPKLDTTPFLKKLASKSIVAERAYSINPHTSKCLVALHCGIEPKPGMAVQEAGRGGMPAKCLPALLKEAGYHTAYFQSPTYWFESRDKLVKNLKYDEFFPGESHPKKGFSQVNYFGYEDKVMLGPAEKWLRDYKTKHGRKPFMLTFLTNTSHHYYGIPKGFPMKQYVKNARFNRYLNTVRYVDGFLKELFDVFKKAGIYKDTVFVISGDHGEAFYEHGYRGHSNHLYEETLRIPYLIHDPSRYKSRVKIGKLVAQFDTLPTVIPLLGYRIRNNKYRGVNILRPSPRLRNVFLSCWKNSTCAGFVNDQEKYIHWFKTRPDEFYDLSRDPEEKQNLAKNQRAMFRNRNEVLNWLTNINGLYNKMGVTH